MLDRNKFLQLPNLLQSVTKISSSKTLFIGSFPKETKGGSSTACLLLLQSQAFSSDNIILLDSTLESISNNVITSRVWRAAKRFGKLTNILISNRPKNALITCGHGWSFFEKGMMLLYLRLFGIKSVITPNSGLILRSFESSYFRWFFKIICSQAKFVVCQGAFWRKTFSQFTSQHQKLVVVKNWIEPESASKPLSPFSIKERDQIKLVYLGWIEEYKGLDDLIDAIHICTQKDVKVHLDIWGEGSYKASVLERIKARELTDVITLKGWATESDKQTIYQDQPIAVLPSHYEGMPNVVLEAMANGLPIIASSVSTLPEMIDHNSNGLLFDVGNVSALANSIETLGKDVLLQKQLREQAKESLSAYDLQNASKRLAELVYTLRTKVLLLTDWFTPAYRAGGPIKSCDNIVKTFGEKLDIRVLTSIHDLGGVRLQVKSNTWLPYHGAQVYYANNFIVYCFKVLTQQLFWRPNKIHINGVFSLKSSIIPLFNAKVLGQRRKVILSLRGMLMPSALHIKSKKKKLYLKIAKGLGLFKRITIHTTNSDELSLSQKSLPRFNNVTIPNLPEVQVSNNQPKYKETGILDIVIVGRVHKIKNIHLLPRFLTSVAGITRTTLIGHLEDQSYLSDIITDFDKLDSHEFRYLGEVDGQQVKEIIKQNHVLFLASQSENYGHAIVESLSQSKPVIISSATPWQDLELYNAGYNFDISNEEKFIQALQQMVNCTNDAYRSYVQGARKYCQEKVFKNETISEYLSLYRN